MNGFASSIGRLNIDFIYGRVPRLPEEGEEVFSESFDVQLGGGPAATMVNLHRLGVKTRFATFLGDDYLSEYAGHMLQSYGIPYCDLYRGTGSALTVTSIISTPRDRTFVSHVFNENADAVSEAELYETFKGSAVAHICLGYDDVWKRLKREGTILVLDSNWRDDLSLDLYKEAFDYVDYFTPNQKEAQKITGTDDPFEALRILTSRVRGTVIKLGGDGCIFYVDDRLVHVSAIHDFDYVDATGAGDAFLSGFIYGLIKNFALQDCAILGNITGAKCVSGIGCLSSWLNEEDLLSLYSRYKDTLILRSPGR